MSLCGKLKCAHAYGNVNCNARVGGEIDPAVEYYNGYIYYSDENDPYSSDPIKPYRMKLDGSEHELVKQLERPTGEYSIKEYS